MLADRRPDQHHLRSVADSMDIEFTQLIISHGRAYAGSEKRSPGPLRSCAVFRLGELCSSAGVLLICLFGWGIS